ncbi:unnamed protein product, partial [Thlaspi arvense]
PKQGLVTGLEPIYKRANEAIEIFWFSSGEWFCVFTNTSAMAEQTEKAFLKQPKVFLCSKKSGKGKRPGKGGNRFWKNIGLGLKTPRDAIEGKSLMMKGTRMNKSLLTTLLKRVLQIALSIRRVLIMRQIIPRRSAEEGTTEQNSCEEPTVKTMDENESIKKTLIRFGAKEQRVKMMRSLLILQLRMEGEKKRFVDFEMGAETRYLQFEFVTYWYFIGLRCSRGVDYLGIFGDFNHRHGSSSKLTCCTRDLTVTGVHLESCGILLPVTMNKLREFNIIWCSISEIKMGNTVSPLHNPSITCFLSLSKAIILDCKCLMELTLLMFRSEF